MAKYRKKIVLVDAWVWDESHKTLQAIGCEMVSWSGHEDRPDECTNLRICTPIGTGSVYPGHYIVKNDDGGFYSYSPERFAEIFEEI